MGDTHQLHCACGATRTAPTHLSIVSCILCGRAMAKTIPRPTPPPSRAVVATAALVTQLLGTTAFALALVWILALHVTSTPVLAITAAGALCVFAGGAAHRGSLRALAACATFDLAVAILLFARPPEADAFLHPALAQLSATAHLALAATLLGAVAALAALTCLAAVPQTRRFAAFRDALH